MDWFIGSFPGHWLQNRPFALAIARSDGRLSTRSLRRPISTGLSLWIGNTTLLSILLNLDDNVPFSPR